jgi:hypothetical protein
MWLSIAFDPSHPGDLAYARLRGAAYGFSKNWRSGEFNARLGDGSLIVGLDGKTSTRLAEATVVGGEIQQYFDIDAGGKVQLFVRGGANLAFSFEPMRTIDLTDDKNAALLGEVGFRLF